MSVDVFLPEPLRPHAGGADRVTLEHVTTVRDALDALFARHPGLRDRVVDERGEPRRHVAIFVGPDLLRHTGGLDTPLADGAELTILPAISGG